MSESATENPGARKRMSRGQKEPDGMVTEDTDKESENGKRDRVKMSQKRRIWKISENNEVETEKYGNGNKTWQMLKTENIRY